ncbi:uncharacterized protein BDV14DRAFT_174088 [Aspergillus stella-maris]|uniref:uncharacterized protein n=1 Tax=Aspergillus stella-maris TaxID=1810926 RepID=UPI003CCDEF27
MKMEKQFYVIRHGRCSCCSTKQRIMKCTSLHTKKPESLLGTRRQSPQGRLRTKWVSGKSGRRRKSTQSMMFMQRRLGNPQP